MLRIIEKQFRKPNGILGKIVSKIMQLGYSKAYDKIINSLEIKENDNLFEIGYGHGLGIEEILSKYNCSISGIDYSELMYHQALKRNKKQIKKGKLKLHFDNFLNHKLKQKHYNKIFCLNVIYFWEKLEIPFSKIKHGLKDNGLFCFYMDHPDELSKQGFMKEDLFNKYTINEVIEKLKLSGFNEISYEQDKMGYYVKCTS